MSNVCPLSDLAWSQLNSPLWSRHGSCRADMGFPVFHHLISTEPDTAGGAGAVCRQLTGPRTPDLCHRHSHTPGSCFQDRDRLHAESATSMTQRRGVPLRRWRCLQHVSGMAGQRPPQPRNRQGHSNTEVALRVKFASAQALQLENRGGGARRCRRCWRCLRHASGTAGRRAPTCWAPSRLWVRHPALGETVGSG